jgi:hypothetical protein
MKRVCRRILLGFNLLPNFGDEAVKENPDIFVFFSLEAQKRYR